MSAKWAFDSGKGAGAQNNPKNKHCWIFEHKGARTDKLSFMKKYFTDMCIVHKNADEIKKLSVWNHCKTFLRKIFWLEQESTSGRDRKKYYTLRKEKKECQKKQNWKDFSFLKKYWSLCQKSFGNFEMFFLYSIFLFLHCKLREVLMKK